MTARLATFKINIQKEEFSFIGQIQHITYHWYYLFVKYDCNCIFPLGKLIKLIDAC